MDRQIPLKISRYTTQSHAYCKRRIMNKDLMKTALLSALILAAYLSTDAQNRLNSQPLIPGNHYANYFTCEELSDASCILIRHSRTAHKYWKRSASLPVKLQVCEKDAATGLPGKAISKELMVKNQPCRTKVKVSLDSFGVEKWPENGGYLTVQFMPFPWYQEHGYYTDSNYFYWKMMNIEGIGKRMMKTYIFPQWKCQPSEYVMYDYFDADVWQPKKWDSQYRILKLKK